ncbi:MMPL family transporter [Actinomadura graeca]|uniref:MMPL family transporter n=1 Tax=Actinomadura graeca TaxID=2750812 RepID=A0ABX8QT54_9ACTN|nr:MMPL family transporter [Actinomadura graeca]QXJ21813.1 MMPL family transporter [Actinomadura graeca]
MLNRAARLSTRHPRLIVLAAVLVAVIAAPLGGGVADLLTSSGFDDPASESARAEKALADRFDVGAPNLVLLVTVRRGTVDDPAASTAGTALTRELAAEPGVDDVLSYWSAGKAPQLRDGHGTRALVIARVTGDEDRVNDRLTTLAPRYERADAALDVRVGGSAEVSHEVDTAIEKDLVRAETIALPITLVLLILAFGGVVAALLPLVVGMMSIVGTFLVLRLLVTVTDVSIYALNLTVALGLGLAIDYSLFVVSRHREELRAGHDPRTAAARAVTTAGRTVAFSALTVAAALLTLLVFPFTFLRSMAYAAVGVTVLAGLLSIVVLPALLVLLGPRVNALTLWRRSVSPPEKGLWYRVATTVMRRPLPVATAAIALLLLLGAPFLSLNLTSLDDRVLPSSSNAREVHDVLRQEFSEESGALSVLAPDGVQRPQIDAYASRLARLPGVARVDAATGTYCGTGTKDCEPGRLLDTSPRHAKFTAGRATYLSVVPSVEPMSTAGQDLVRDVRDAQAPWPVQVTGESAALVDSNHSLLTRLPLALALVAVITAVLLFLMFGSVTIPITAIALDVLSLTATFGAMVWVFQDGHLSGLLGFTATGGLNASMPVLMFCVAFGLSMDYEVMLLSRIKEEYDKGADNATSIATGLQRAGRILTAAALLIAVVMIAFATSRVSFIKLFGVGLALAVLVDAFLIRGTLVPAVMRLTGTRNWWSPPPLNHLHRRKPEHPPALADGRHEDKRPGPTSLESPQ